MPLEYPYQVVTFLASQPQQNESVYRGQKGWYPQVALKRRFRLYDTSEDELISILHKFVSKCKLPVIETGHLQSVDRMPVRVIPVTNQATLRDYHAKLQKALSGHIESRYPERDGENYFPHITAEDNGEIVINVENFEHKELRPTNIWLIKDSINENSIAYRRIA